jgi:energy-coupling factor transporter ATP-binding protein EcfA2
MKINMPSAHVSELVFSNGTSVTVKATDVVLIVGPNNAGKSETLRAIKEKLVHVSAQSPVLNSIVLTKCGSGDEFKDSVTTFAKRKDQGAQGILYSASGHDVYESQISSGWQHGVNELGNLAQWVCSFLSADYRLHAANPAQNIDLLKEGPKVPIHYLQNDDSIEERISNKFKKAFGLDLIVNRNAGSLVPLHVGIRPSFNHGEDRVSRGYLDRLEKLPQLQTQGHGMRSFAGVLLATSVGHESIFLIDEPEAFLHPPQARLLAGSLIQDKGQDRQLFIATHSTDILRGALDSKNADVKVLRIQRRGDVNSIKVLASEKVKELWNDPLLRYSNIFDGLFHEGVVVCESDSDCKFYAAILEAALENQTSDAKRPDLMFTHCGGKHRLPLVIRSLREVDVPVCAVADFDVLSEEQPLRSIAEALGLEWEEIKTDWSTVKSGIDAKRPDMSTSDVKSEFEKIIASVDTINLPETVRVQLQTLLKKSSAWSNAKAAGKLFIPSGDASSAFERLALRLRKVGLNIVEVGEIEAFSKTTAGHGPKWVNAVLTKNLATDKELEPARQFALQIASSIAGTA